MFPKLTPYDRNSVEVECRGGSKTRPTKENYAAALVDVVLLPMQGGIRLDDDAFLRPALEFLDQRSFPRFQRLRNLGMDAKRDAARTHLRRHLARLGLNFVAQRRDGFHHAGAGAIRAGLAEGAFQGLLGAFARDRHQTKFIEAQHFRRRAVGAQRIFQHRHHFLAVAALFHVNEIDNDDPAQIAQAHLAHDFLAGFQVRAHDGVFEPVRALADKFSGVHVNRHQRFGVIDHNVAAGLQPNFRAQALVNFLLDAELFEYWSFLSVKLHEPHQLRLEAAHEVHYFGVFLFGVHPDRAEIRSEEHTS